ncbi:DUF58 domain-containing protein [Halomicroarcula sp. F13]|uniref:DUF58 domain-containing protein n=1 Tax=Haloarcula rubra TaxID=2487747 RepID=A0AAW4PSR0_9EURY|nr:DUF58 domain-containing protein [Halomicroarcula rubra]MBX0324296.1 DUF58 domain-containing protein [Halomicroarcula rubra]
MSDARRTHRWRGVLVLTLGAAGVGLLAKRPLLLMLSALGVVYAVYPRLSSVSEPRLDIDRRVSEENPQAGTSVEVTTTVQNVGDRPIFDLRVVDGVPPALAVTDGTPRFGTALRPGERASFSYTMTAKRGRHRFEAATAIARDPSGGHEVEVEVETDTEVDCTTDVGTAPLRSQTLDVTGQNPADSGGSGTEFHQTRAYRRGDPVGRVDWNRYARTGELTTIEFREEQTASVVVVVDATPGAYRGREGEPHAVVAAVGAAQQLAETVLDGQNHVGLSVLGTDDLWLAPSSGRRHRLRLQELLATHSAFEARPPEPETTVDVEAQVETLLARLEDNTQLLVVSPLLDDDVVEAVQRFEAERHRVTLVSPDVTVSDAGAGGRTLAAIERDSRLRRLRQSDVTAVDWETTEPLSATLHRRTEAMHG